MASCSGQGPVGLTPAATVGGVVIEQSAVQDLLDAQRRYYESLDDPAAAERLTAFLGQSDGTFALPEASKSLESLINAEIARQYLADHKRPLTKADLDAARSEIESQLSSQQIALDSVDKALLDFTVESSAAANVLREMMAKQVAAAVDDAEREAQIQALFEELAPQRPLCLNIIVSESEADAQAARARVEGGEDFAAVAAEVSADPNTAAVGGYAGCAQPEQATQAFGGDYTNAKVGDLSGPFNQNDVWVTIEIGSTTGPTLDQMRPELERQVTALDDQKVTTRLAEVVMKADVTVDPRFGIWDPETGTITPPVAPTPATSTTSTLPVGAP